MTATYGSPRLKYSSAPQPRFIISSYDFGRTEAKRDARDDRCLRGSASHGQTAGRTFLGGDVSGPLAGGGGALSSSVVGGEPGPLSGVPGVEIDATLDATIGWRSTVEERRALGANAHHQPRDDL